MYMCSDCCVYGRNVSSIDGKVCALSVFQVLVSGLSPVSME